MLQTLPSVTRYLEKLPAGVASYPGCAVKASVVRSCVDSRPLGPEVPLPPEVRALVERPPLVSAWVSEVHYIVVMLTIREVHFPGADPAPFTAWVHERNVQLLSAPLYRALFFLLSPERLFNGLARRWGVFRRGSELHLLRLIPGEVDLTLRTPPNLYVTTIAQAVAAALCAALEHAGARHARVE